MRLVGAVASRSRSRRILAVLSPPASGSLSGSAAESSSAVANLACYSLLVNDSVVCPLGAVFRGLIKGEESQGEGASVGETTLR